MALYLQLGCERSSCAHALRKERPPPARLRPQVVFSPAQVTSLGFGENGVTSGTFVSTSEVAGTVALMLQKNPNLKVSDIRCILNETAVDTDAPLEWEGPRMMDPKAAIASTPQLC